VVMKNLFMNWASNQTRVPVKVESPPEFCKPGRTATQGLSF
jgi:hypothetical protein